MQIVFHGSGKAILPSVVCFTYVCAVSGYPFCFTYACRLFLKQTPPCKDLSILLRIRAQIGSLLW